MRCLNKLVHLEKTKKSISELWIRTLRKEREGLRFSLKNASFQYKNCKVNIIDTPGHADFGGEVERILKMADGGLLLVDAVEGPMAQTKFVLRKALEAKLKIIVLINKIDMPNAKPLTVVDAVLDLFIELGASESQLDFPYIFSSAKKGYSVLDPESKPNDMSPLLDLIIKAVPPPSAEISASFQMLANSLDYSDYLGEKLL